MTGIGDGQVQFTFICTGCDPDFATCRNVVFCRVVDEVNKEPKDLF